MQRFKYNDITYRSLSEFSKLNNVSYSALKRLCRNYVRAQKDPKVACDWLTGRQVFNSHTERKTVKALREREQTRVRAERYRYKKSAERALT